MKINQVTMDKVYYLQECLAHKKCSGSVSCCNTNYYYYYYCYYYGKQ